LADLDLVNPYFRTREAAEPLSKMGIKMVLPPEIYLKADLPILSPSISGMIRTAEGLGILDVGGDDVGARVLASLADALRGKSVRMFQVVNPFRPFTETVEGCTRIRTEIEKASKLKVNGIIGNANLIDATTPEDVINGYHFVAKYAKKTGLPLSFIAVENGLKKKLDMTTFACPVLILNRQLVPPWKKPGRIVTHGEQ
jgi:hypothetical protein